HPQIGDDHVEAGLVEPRQRLRPALDDLGREALLSERRAEDPPDRHVVVHDEDADDRAIGGWAAGVGHRAAEATTTRDLPTPHRNRDPLGAMATSPAAPSADPTERVVGDIHELDGELRSEFSNEDLA